MPTGHGRWRSHITLVATGEERITVAHRMPSSSKVERVNFSSV